MFSLFKVRKVRCWNTVWKRGRTSSLWGWQSTRTGCPEGLWILLIWRCSKPSWMRSCAAYCRWPCFGRGLGPDDPKRSLPTATILWFCDSVILYNEVFREQTQSLVWPHQAQTVFFFSWCVLSVGVYTAKAERIGMSCGTCTMREVAEFIIPVACQSPHSLTVGCHTTHISHGCRILMGDTLFSALFLFFSLHNTFPVGKKALNFNSITTFFPYSLH